MRTLHPDTCIITILVAAVASVGNPSPAADAPPAIQPVTIFSWPGSDGRQRLGDSFSLQAAKKSPKEALPIFQALPTDEWWSGMVPLFAIEKDGAFALRRTPLKGHENLIEPLFFALPADDDVNARRIAGTWRCTATRAGAEDAWFGWQLTTDGDRVIGRFDPHSDYRVAYFKGGSVRTLQLEWIVEYSNAAYVLKGEWHDGKMAGSWTGKDPEEQGRWEAVRPAQPSPPQPDGKVVPLYEWRLIEGPGMIRRYSTVAQASGWTRAEKPLCRVWALPAGASTINSVQPNRDRSQP